MFKKLTFVITFIWAIYAVKSLPAYPPCVSCNCIGNQCAGNGMFPLWAKLEWSELTGINTEFCPSFRINYIKHLNNYSSKGKLWSNGKIIFM